MGQIWENFKVESNIVVQQLSHVRPCHPMNIEHQASLSFTASWILLKLMSIELMKVILDTEEKNDFSRQLEAGHPGQKNQHKQRWRCL